MFDILKWWKLKGMNTYPTLALVAKDVLAIQVSTVASESAFSTGGRVIDAFRSSLTPKLVESLICLQNWLRNEDISNIEYEASKAKIEFYQECESGKFLNLLSFFHCVVSIHRYSNIICCNVKHKKDTNKSIETTSSQKDKGKGVVIL
ncbi:hypothetical protein Dimus_039514 [Dionaea muscipula]